MVRDATFMLWGLYTLGFEWEANDFFHFLADVAEAEPDDLQIMYRKPHRYTTDPASGAPEILRVPCPDPLAFGGPLQDGDHPQRAGKLLQVDLVDAVAGCVVI